MRWATARLVGLLLVAAALVASPVAEPRAAAAGDTTEVTTTRVDSRYDGVQDRETIRPPFVRAWSYDDPNVAAALTAAGRVFVYLYGGPDGGYGFRVVALDAASGSTAWGPVALGGTYYGAGITYADGRVVALDRDGVVTALDAATGRQLWQVDLPYQYGFSEAPTAFRGVVYITGEGNGSTLYALSAATGALLWSHYAGQGAASPVVVDDSGVYWTLGCHETLAYHLDGSTKWYRPADCGQEGGGPASLHEGRLYLSGGPNLVLDAETGATLGRYPFSWVPPTFSGSRLVVLRWRTLTALDQPGGPTAWVGAGDGTFQSAPTSAGDFVYIGGSSGGLFALDASTGRTAWSAELPQQFGGSGVHSVTVGGGHVLAIHDLGLTAFAEPPVSVAGPQRVLKGSSALLQLHGAPGATVEVWFRPAGAASFTIGRSVVMDATGHASTTWTFAATTSYYASSGGATSAVVTTTAVPTVTLRPGEPPTAATTFLTNPRHDSSQPGETIAPPLVRAWSVALPGVVSYPVVAGGRVFVTVRKTDYTYGTWLYALDLRSGRTLWGPVALGGIYQFSAVAYDAGRLFAVSRDLVRALDAATGTELWSAAPSGGVEAAPTPYGGRVHINGGSAGLVALDARTGATAWTGDVGTTTGSSAPSLDASGAYVSYDCEITFAFSHTGATRWLHRTACYGGGGRTSVLAGDRLYVRDLPAGYAPAVLNTASGQWLDDFVSELPPAIAGSTMYNTVNGVLYATDLATHLPRWRLVVPGGVVVTPVVANGRVWTAAGDGTVRALDAATGRVLWSASAGTSVTPLDEDDSVVRTGIAVAEGRLVVPARDRLTAFTQPVVLSGPARTTYGATVTLTATAWPGASIRVWVRRGAETTWRLLTTLTADSRGRATASLRADNDYRWYAQADGLSSAVGTTLVAPTVSGPALVAKGSTVTVTGTTVPARSVGLWFRKAGTTSYVLRATRTANSYGRFAMSYVADATYSYYAATTCCRSAVVTTKVW